MKVWFLADTHFGCKSDNETWLNDYMSYFNQVVIPLMKEKVQKGDILVHLGDVFDNRQNVGINTLVKTIDLFTKFSEIFDDIRVIVGNHDIYNKSSNDITSINVLKHIPNVKIYYEPIVEVLAGKTVLFNPWIENKEREIEVLNKYNCDYVFGHLEISGVQASSRAGLKLNTAGSVEYTNFKKSQVYAGHIHIRQDFKNIHYVGTPYHKDRGDRDNIKGITILDIKSGKTEFYENTYSPRFIRESIYSILDTTIGELKKKWNNNYIDLHILGSDITKVKMDELCEELKPYYKEFLQQSDNSSTAMVGGGSDFEDTKSTEEHMVDWLNIMDVPEQQQNRILDKIEKMKELL